MFPNCVSRFLRFVWIGGIPSFYMQLGELWYIRGDCLAYLEQLLIHRKSLSDPCPVERPLFSSPENVRPNSAAQAPRDTGIQYGTNTSSRGCLRVLVRLRINFASFVPDLRIGNVFHVEI